MDALKNTSTLTLRVASGVILAPVVLACIIYGGKAFAALLILVALLSIYEWLMMAQKSPRPVFDGTVGIVYILLCFAAFASLRYHYGAGAGLVLCLVLAVWATDIGAYFSGKTFGGAKMSPGISPNKTWAGLIGGVIASMLVFVAYKLSIRPFSVESNLPDIVALQTITLWKVAVIGAVLAVVGQTGDLFVSMQKRKAGVKDSGHLIPGHGGILDRIDSLLLAAPAFIICLNLAAA